MVRWEISQETTANERIRSRHIRRSCLLLQEPGGDEVATLLEGRAIISAVNVQELLVKLLAKGMTSRHARLTIKSLNLECHPHSMEDAEASAELTEHTKAKD